MRHSLFAALPLLAMLVVGCTTRAAECQRLSACVQELRAMAQAKDNPYSSVGADSEKLKQRILSQPGAVDALIPLLKDPDERVAVLAAVTLRDAPTIDPVYLPQIREGLDRDLGWLAPALARIGTEEAAKEAVNRYL